MGPLTDYVSAEDARQREADAYERGWEEAASGGVIGWIVALVMGVVVGTALTALALGHFHIHL